MAVDVHEHWWIPMSDGSRLAARAWIPRSAAAAPVPAVLEYIPYRKRAGTRWRDEPIHGYFAERGFACLRVDVRGSGESDGHLEDEYSEDELRDGEELLAWIARQPWCDGAVGMIGKSWGGINALQLAARRPPALRAVITVCSTDDRYGLDAHYMGGCLLGENLLWGSSLLTLAAMPPDPSLTGRDWQELWRRRIDRLPFYPARWMRHPRRDDYWRRGSVREAYDRIACPVLAVGGWADAYTGSVLRLLRHLEVPRRGLIGPWSHLYPHDAAPEASVDFLQEAVAWWNRWLRERRPGAPSEREPLLRVWLGEASEEPSPDRASPGGRWVAEDRWPSNRVRSRSWRLAPGSLEPAARRPAGESVLEVTSSAVVGSASGRWCPFGEPGDYPRDQRADDALSVCFDSEPLDAPLDLLGSPAIVLELADEPGRRLLAARLCDVAPSGASTRITYGLLDLSGREGTVALDLEPAGWTIRKGHRLRLALSTSYWPLAWPALDPGGFQIRLSGSRLELPVRRATGPEATVVLPPPAPAPEPRMTEIGQPAGGRTRLADPDSGAEELRVRHGRDAEGRLVWTVYEEIGIRVGHAVSERYRIHPGDPGTAEAEIEHERAVAGDGWLAEVRVRCRLATIGDAFHLDGSLEARLDDVPLAARTWAERIPRSDPGPPDSGSDGLQ